VLVNRVRSLIHLWFQIVWSLVWRFWERRIPLERALLEKFEMSEAIQFYTFVFIWWSLLFLLNESTFYFLIPCTSIHLSSKSYEDDYPAYTWSYTMKNVKKFFDWPRYRHLSNNPGSKGRWREHFSKLSTTTCAESSFPLFLWEPIFQHQSFMFIKFTVNSIPDLSNFEQISIH